MKTRFLIFFLAVLLLSGCSNKETSTQSAKEGAAGEPAATEAIQNNMQDDETQSVSEDEEPKRETVSMNFRFVFIHDDSDILLSKIQDVRVGTVGDGIYAESGQLTSDHVYHDEQMPRMIVDEEDVLFSEEGINDYRRLNFDLYNDNMADNLETVVHLFAECNEVFLSTGDMHDGFPIDCTERMPSVLHININGSTIDLDVASSHVGASCVVTHKDEDTGEDVSELTGIRICFDIPAENLPQIKEYYSIIADECSMVTEELDWKSITFEDKLNVEMPEIESTAYTEEESEEEPVEEEKTADEETEVEKTPEGTGIIGKWYPEYTDYSVYYIQIDEGGVGEIHQGDRVIPITYTFDGRVVRVVLSIGGSNEFYYDGNTLTSDFDGDIYKKR